MASRDGHPDYRDCTDRHCPRYPCRVYREGVEHGYRVGVEVGRAEAWAEAWAAGYRQGLADYEPKVIYITVSSGS